MEMGLILLILRAVAERWAVVWMVEMGGPIVEGVRVEDGSRAGRLIESGWDFLDDLSFLCMELCWWEEGVIELIICLIHSMISLV
jgi:hypothetical protein